MDQIFLIFEESLEGFFAYFPITTSVLSGGDREKTVGMERQTGEVGINEGASGEASFLTETEPSKASGRSDKLDKIAS